LLRFCGFNEHILDGMEAVCARGSPKGLTEKSMVLAGLAVNLNLPDAYSEKDLKNALISNLIL